MPSVPNGVPDFRWSSMYEGLSAGCVKCRWRSAKEQEVELASKGKLVCFGCGQAAVVGFDPSGTIRSESISESVHESVSRPPEGEGWRLWRVTPPLGLVAGGLIDIATEFGTLADVDRSNLTSGFYDSSVTSEAWWRPSSYRRQKEKRESSDE